MNKSNLDVARKCLIRLGDWSYLDLIDAHLQTYGTNEADHQHFLAQYYSYRGLFSEAAKLYKKMKMEQSAIEMFYDLQMYEQANDYNVQNVQIELRTERSGFDQMETTPPATTNKWQTGNVDDIQTMCQLYISNEEYDKALQLISNSSSERLEKGLHLISRLNQSIDWFFWPKHF